MARGMIQGMARSILLLVGNETVIMDLANVSEAGFRALSGASDSN